MQEAFLAIWRGAAKYLPERAKASTWIMTLVHRRAVDLVRREERRRAEPLPEVEPDAGGPVGGRQRLAAPRARARAGGAQPAARPAARGDRARLLRRVHAVGARGAAGRAARHDQEPDVRGSRAAARAARRRSTETHGRRDGPRAERRLRARRARARGARGVRGASRVLRELPGGGRRPARSPPSELAWAAEPAGAAAGAPRPDPRGRARRAAERRAAAAAPGDHACAAVAAVAACACDRPRDLERLAAQPALGCALGRSQRVPGRGSAGLAWSSARAARRRSSRSACRLLRPGRPTRRG